MNNTEISGTNRSATEYHADTQGISGERARTKLWHNAYAAICRVPNKVAQLVLRVGAALWVHVPRSSRRVATVRRERAATVCGIVGESSCIEGSALDWEGLAVGEMLRYDAWMDGRT